VENDPEAWRVILESDIPVVVATMATTYRDLDVEKESVSAWMTTKGPVEKWLLREFTQFVDVPTLRWYENEAPKMLGISKPAKMGVTQSLRWAMWDFGAPAFLLGFTKAMVHPRPTLDNKLQLVPSAAGGQITWLTEIDGRAVYADFVETVRSFSSNHEVRDLPCVTVAHHPQACWRSIFDRE
jgi:hypothetical protein